MVEDNIKALLSVDKFYNDIANTHKKRHRIVLNNSMSFLLYVVVHPAGLEPATF